MNFSYNKLDYLNKVFLTGCVGTATHVVCVNIHYIFWKYFYSIKLFNYVCLIFSSTFSIVLCVIVIQVHTAV